MLYYRPSRNDADEHSAVIRDRYEVGLHCPDNQILDGSADRDRRILLCLVDEIRQPELLKALDGHGVRFASLALDNEPKEISLADRSDIMAFSVKYRYGGKTVGMHLFERLPNRRIGIYENYILLGACKKSDVHACLRKSGSAQILVNSDLERSCGKSVLCVKRRGAVGEESVADL